MPVAGSKVLESATKVSVQVIARLLMISERRVQQLANEGVIPRTETRRYNLEESVQAYIQFLQGKNVGRGMADEQIDFHEEKARLTKIQADKAQLELDEMARVGQGPAPRITSTRLGDRGPLIGAGAVGIRRMRRLSPS